MCARRPRQAANAPTQSGTTINERPSHLRKRMVRKTARLRETARIAPLARARVTPKSSPAAGLRGACRTPKRHTPRHTSHKARRSAELAVARSLVRPHAKGQSWNGTIAWRSDGIAWWGGSNRSRWDAKTRVQLVARLAGHRPMANCDAELPKPLSGTNYLNVSGIEAHEKETHAIPIYLG